MINKGFINLATLISSVFCDRLLIIICVFFCWLQLLYISLKYQDAKFHKGSWEDAEQFMLMHFLISLSVLPCPFAICISKTLLIHALLVIHSSLFCFLDPFSAHILSMQSFWPSNSAAYFFPALVSHLNLLNDVFFHMKMELCSVLLCYGSCELKPCYPLNWQIPSV